ncbi:hypothetical protein ASG31_06045 [Chryseobacterium sp. Leaf404]|uniref:lipocalin family protein n=1 Tax=unclassified Chryseobacterium TaxID=2593645 RepID=UPI000701FE40|nr:MULTISPECIES: lipocalin family protein [unclassified Chryseobacterium]KQT18286.1 hypothetical protein ASG31_06045 [Chryseobacterium sp. Leaf404]
MKKLLLLALSAGFMCNSCTVDDDDEFTNQFSLLGVWHPSREIVVSGSTGITLSNTDYSPCYQSSTLEFKTNNTVVTNIFDVNITGNCVSTGIETVNYSYDHTNSKLVIDGENIEIISRTQNELQFVSHYEDEDGDGVDDKIIIVINK